MAEKIPYSVASSLIERLASVAFREFGRIYGVMDQLERLKNTIESIEAVLCDAEERQEHDRAVQIWIRRLKEVLLAADILFDDLAIEDLRHKVKGRKKIAGEVCRFFSSSNPIAFRQQLAHKIENIRQSFNDLEGDMSKLNLSPRVVVIKENEFGLREKASFVLESDIIGREDSKREVVNLLKQSHRNQNVSSIAIVGLGGLGKTTIAQLVYNDVEVQNFFEKRMWVCVSDNFDVRILVKKILESLIIGKMAELSLDNLQTKLREELSGKRYLLVLDDVWNESHEKWSQLRTYLMCGAQDSKVLVTTRNEGVAYTIGVTSLYKLKGLAKQESQSLLKKIAFGEHAEGMNRTLESIGEKIAEKCKGVPLAIKAVGGLLKSKNEESEWMNVLDGDFWNLCEDEDSIMPVLKLSYQNLPPHLRQCFAYCSLYPKDYEIETNELVQLWMAQGYLQCSTENQHMEDVGNRFVKILLMKSFFQDAAIDEYGDIRCFKMHDLMHDLATRVAGNDFHLHSEGKGLGGSPMHVSLEPDAVGLLDSLDKSRLQTLLLQSEDWEMEVRLMRKQLCVISSFKCLRTLNLSSSSSEKLPDSIGELKYLRYLNLSDCQELRSLPKSVSNLISLQTLKLKGCEKLEFSTKAVTKLINLRHLDIRDCKAFEDMVPSGLGKLSSLQYLSTFVVGDGRESKAGKLNELKDLNNLRGCLEIKKLGWGRDVVLESQEVNLREKKLLRSLELDLADGIYGNCGDNNGDSLKLLENLRPHRDLKELRVWRYPGERFPDWLSSLTNIVEMNLGYCSKCRYLPPLERLSSLKRLYIGNLKDLQYIYFEEVSPTAITFFPSLEILEFYRCEKLRGWQRMGDDTEYPHYLSLPPFPCLSQLEIFKCPKLTYMPAYPHLDGEFSLYSSSAKTLTETLKTVAPTSSADSSSSFTPLSMLKSLEISELLEIKALPKGWMQNLTSLERLAIDGSQSLSPREFENWFMDNLNCLPSLQSISLSGMELNALPDCICDLPLLCRIELSNCPYLASLPDGMRRLTNLRVLLLSYCPLLIERCQRETGADWHKIAHVREVLVRP